MVKVGFERTARVSHAGVISPSAVRVKPWALSERCEVKGASGAALSCCAADCEHGNGGSLESRAGR